MEAGLYIRTLAEFVTGEINLPKLRQFVEERLFELRQNPEVTDEKIILASVELYLHEAAERLRDESDVYAHVQSVLDNIILARPTSVAETVYFSPTPPLLPCRISRTFDLDPPTKQPTIPKELSLTLSQSIV